MFGLLLCLCSSVQKRGIAAAGRPAIMDGYPFANTPAVELNDEGLQRAIACTRPSWGGYDDENSETNTALDFGDVVDAITDAVEQAIAVTRPGWGGWDDDDENSDKSHVPALEFKKVTTGVRKAIDQAVSASGRGGDAEAAKLVASVVKDAVKKSVSAKRPHTNGPVGTGKALDLRPVMSAIKMGISESNASNPAIEIFFDILSGFGSL